MLGLYVSSYFTDFSPELDYFLTFPVVRDTLYCLRAASCTFFLLLGLKEILGLPRSAEASSYSWRVCSPASQLCTYTLAVWSSWD